MRDVLKNKILNITDFKVKKNGEGISTEKDFEDLAFQIFEYQYKYNAFYQRYCSLIGKELSKINHLSEIPFLPIQFFKSHIVVSNNDSIQATFSSSGTTALASTSASTSSATVETARAITELRQAQLPGKSTDSADAATESDGNPTRLRQTYVGHKAMV